MDETTDSGRGRALRTISAVVALLTIAGIGLAAGGVLRSAESATESFDATALSLDLGASGTIEIRGTADEEITVETRVRDIWGLTTADARVDNSTLHLESRCTAGWVWLFFDGCRVDYVVTVPETTTVRGDVRNGQVTISELRTDVDIDARNGGVTMSDVGGSVRLNSRNGNVDVRRVDGTLVVESHNGRLRIEDVTSTGPIDLTSRNGAIEVTRTSGDLRMEGRNGNIVLVDVESDVITASTRNGRIRMSLASSPNRISAESRNGHVEIRLPTDAPAYAIATQTRNGRTNVDGVVNDPGSSNSISVETINGNITVDTH